MKKHHKEANDETTVISDDEREFDIRVIDGCEYIEYSAWINPNCKIYTITHKGNCKYCKQRSNN